MSNIPIGIYHHGETIVHRLNAASKLICLILFLVCVICTKSLIGYALLFSFVFIALLISRLPYSAAVGSVKRLIPFFAVILFMNICFFSNDNIWFKLWIFTPSLAGLMQGLNIILRVILLMLMSAIVTMTTPPVEITRALELILYPLRFIGVSTAQVAMILSVAIQFVPTLAEEAITIRLAQTARGARFESKRLSEKAGAAAPLVIPIFLSAFKRADELSLAMEARGYRIRRDKVGLKLPRFSMPDIITILLLTVLSALYIFFI